MAGDLVRLTLNRQCVIFSEKEDSKKDEKKTSYSKNEDGSAATYSTQWKPKISVGTTENYTSKPALVSASSANALHNTLIYKVCLAKSLQYHSLATAARIENPDCWEEEAVDTFKGSDGGGKRIVKMETPQEKSEIEIPPETKI